MRGPAYIVVDSGKRVEKVRGSEVRGLRKWKNKLLQFPLLIAEETAKFERLE
jgi:hypothetical protein